MKRVEYQGNKHARKVAIKLGIRKKRQGTPVHVLKARVARMGRRHRV